LCAIKKIEERPRKGALFLFLGVFLSLSHVGFVAHKKIKTGRLSPAREKVSELSAD
jgi:hypothetical protein